MSLKRTREMKTPYLTLESMKYNSSKPYLMISEFIDNSIASWNGEHNKDANDNPMPLSRNLRIDIIFDFGENKITIKDNAYGMDQEELLHSVELNDKKQGDVLSKFGVGMKTASFWFAQDLTINTVKNNLSNTTNVLLSEKIKNNELSDVVTWEVQEPKHTEQDPGTIIILENIYKDKKLTTNDCEELIKVLSNRFSGYLFKRKDGFNTSIYVRHYKDKNSKPLSTTVEPLKNNVQTIPKNLVEEFIERIKKVPNPKILIDLREKAIQAALDGKPQEFSFSLKIPFRKGLEIKTKFGIQDYGKVSDEKNQKKAFKSGFGISAYQNKRAIRMAGINAIPFKATYKPDARLDYTRKNIKSAFGFMDLGLVFEPDNNKRDFMFGIDKGSFETWIQNIGLDMVRLCDIVKELINRNQHVPVKKLRPASAKQAENALDSKSEAFEWKISSSDPGAKMTFVGANNKKYTIHLHEVSIKDVNHEQYFVHASERNDENDSYDIFYNVNHTIWKPLAGEAVQIDLKTVVYPFVTILGLAQIGIRDQLMKEWLGHDSDGDDYLSTIAKISRYGLKVG